MLAEGRHKYIRTLEPNEPEELYDLLADPEELTNLATDPAHACDRAKTPRRSDRGAETHRGEDGDHTSAGERITAHTSRSLLI